MNNEEIFKIWAPAGSPWSPWAKPVLFAHLNLRPNEVISPQETADLAWFTPPLEGTAIILDLPGAEGVWVGLTLATRGYRPVPLYNAIPIPMADLVGAVDSFGQTAVKVLPIIDALAQAAETLAAQNLPAHAPPAFLLDANRHAPGYVVQPVDFDNRSICFTTDFPSANFLAARGIKRVLLVQRSRQLPQSDLAQVLRRWQDSGLSLQRIEIDKGGAPEDLMVPRPSWYGAMFQRVLSAIGLRRAGSGG